MKVYFGCTTHNWDKYKDNYFKIRDYLISMGCIINDDWLPDADLWVKKHKGQSRNIKYVYNKVVNSIIDADVIVIEYTVPNFSSSHQINLGIMQRKPTLVLRLYKDNENFSDSYIEAIESPYLTIREYTIDNYKSIIEEFIGFSKIGKGLQRYNVVLDKDQKYYLDWASNRYNISRSEIIRDLLNSKIHSDLEFKKYIK